MTGRLNGKVAIVTGGARGLGRAQAEVFCEEGASVVIGDVLVEEGQALAAGLSGKGLTAVFHRIDVSSPGDWNVIVEATVGQYGKLTTLINNAGIYRAGGLEEETDETWERMIAVNQTGAFLGMRTAIPTLIASGNGAIVNISSVMGLRGTVKCFGYHAAKGALRTMSQAAAVEYATQNVRVNSVYPGAIEAPSHLLTRADDSARVRAMTPMGHKGEPRDIAYACLYLCSDEAKYVTGAEFVIDGGMNAV